MKLWNWIILGLILAAGFIQPVAAQSPTPVPSDDAVNNVAKEMYCPVCENIPLDVCPTQACKQWRELIREKLAAGWDERQIKDYFVRQYGDRVLAEPPRRGLNWLVYVLPPLVMIFGAYLVYRVLSRVHKPETVTIASQVEAALPGDTYLKKIEEDLKKRTK
jgi:cytochrome c-type biogenesis protein CcmH